MGLAEKDLTKSFDLVIGLSAGAAGAAYFVGGNTEVGQEVYTKDLAGRKFIKKSRFVNPYAVQPPMDFQYLREVLEGSRGIDQEAIRNSETDFYVGVTNRNGEGELLNMKSLGDMVGGILASCAMPIGYNKAVRLKMPDERERPFGDGEIGNGIPLAFALEQGCTDIMIIQNSPGMPNAQEQQHAPLVERMLLQWYMSRYPQEFRAATINRRAHYWQTRNHLGRAPFNLQVIAPETDIVGRLTTNATKLKRAMEHGKTIVENVIYTAPSRLKVAA